MTRLGKTDEKKVIKQRLWGINWLGYMLRSNLFSQNTIERDKRK